MYIIDSRPTSYIYVIMYMCGPEFFDISCLIEIYMSETHTDVPDASRYEEEGQKGQKGKSKH